MIQYQQVDSWRTVLPMTQFGLCALTPIPLLYILAIAPTRVLGTTIKQIISLPLLASLLIVPYFYRDSRNGNFTAFCQVIPFTMFLRFSDVFWITPVIYKRDAYIEASKLIAEFWSCVRVDPKAKRDRVKVGKQDAPAKEKVDSSQEKSVETIEYVKDKKYYHLFIPMLLNTVVYDTLAAYIKTFSEADLLKMQATSFKQCIFFFCTVACALTVLLNLFGQIMQLAYVVVVDHGSYAPAEWRHMMNYPIFSTSLEDVWSRRWHRVLRPAWIASSFKPVYYIVDKWTESNSGGKKLATGLASMAVFAASGLTHEYSVLCNAGWQVYKQNYIGDQMIFFGIHGIFVVLEKFTGFIYKSFLPKSVINSPIVRVLLNIYVILFATWTFPLFINGFAHWGLWRLNELTPIDPAVRDYLAATPYLRQYCGSLL